MMTYTHFGRGEPDSELLELTLERPFNFFGPDDAPAERALVNAASKAHVHIVDIHAMTQLLQAPP